VPELNGAALAAGEPQEAHAVVSGVVRAAHFPSRGRRRGALEGRRARRRTAPARRGRRHFRCLKTKTISSITPHQPRRSHFSPYYAPGDGFQIQRTLSNRQRNTVLSWSMLRVWTRCTFRLICRALESREARMATPAMGAAMKGPFYGAMGFNGGHGFLLRITTFQGSVYPDMRDHLGPGVWSTLSDS